MDYTNKALGLRTQTQIPLNVKEYIKSEEDLKDLGPGNNLAFIYEKGLIIYCIQEATRYEWKEMEVGDIGLLDNNFIYPDNIVTFGIDYSNKEYNFVKVELGENIDQNNYVRNIVISVNDLIENYTKQNIIDYILALPNQERTIEDTDSKFNIIIGNIEGEGLTIIEIYELQNIGKGIITSLVPDNLLNITRKFQGLQSVLDINGYAVLENLSIFYGDSIFEQTISGLVDEDESKSYNNYIIQNENGIGLNGYANLDEYNQDGASIAISNGNFIIRQSITRETFARYTQVSFEEAIETTTILIPAPTTEGTHYFALREDLNKKKQKILTYPDDFISSTYTLQPEDDEYLLIIDNGSNAVSILVSSELPTPLPESFFVAIIQEGTADISIVQESVTINTPVGLKIKGQNYSVGLDRKGNTNIFFLTGNTKI